MSEQEFRSKLQAYLFGGCTALVITAASFLLVTSHSIIGPFGVVVLLVLAVIQAGTQLYFFLHLGDEKKPRWQGTSLAFAVFLMLILVTGSIWIMIHLNYNMQMTPEQMEKYMLQQDKGGF